MMNKNFKIFVPAILLFVIINYCSNQQKSEDIQTTSNNKILFGLILGEDEQSLNLKLSKLVNDKIIKKIGYNKYNYDFSKGFVNTNEDGDYFYEYKNEIDSTLDSENYMITTSTEIEFAIYEKQFYRLTAKFYRPGNLYHTYRKLFTKKYGPPESLQYSINYNCGNFEILISQSSFEWMTIIYRDISLNEKVINKLENVLRKDINKRFNK